MLQTKQGQTNIRFTHFAMKRGDAEYLGKAYLLGGRECLVQQESPHLWMLLLKKGFT
jgi:hypothetical protein